MRSNEQLKAKMYGYISHWESSGLNQKEFCKQNGINYYKFKYWKTRKNKEQEPVRKKQPPIQPGFIPITLPDHDPVISGIEITFPNGVKLNCSQGLEPSQVKELIKLF